MCHQYWPNNDGGSIDGAQYGIHMVYTLETKRYDGFVVRKLGVTAPNVSMMNSNYTPVYYYYYWLHHCLTRAMDPEEDSSYRQKIAHAQYLMQKEQWNLQ